MSRLPKTISVEKLDNSVLFTFAQNQHYLYDGTIEVPFNSLSIIADKSEAITLRKSASNDIFISAPWQNFDINASSKEEAVDALTDMLYDEAGISQEEVQGMIDAATSGIPSSQTIEELRNDVNTISGNVQTLSGEVATKADASDLQALSEKVDTKLDASAYTPTDLSEYWTSAETKSYVDGKVDDALDDYYDKDYVDGALADKLDTSAYTPTDLSEYWTSAQTQSAIDAATSGIPSSQTIEELRTDVNTISGNVENNYYDKEYIDEKEEVVASALTELNLRLNEDEEVTAAALNDLNDRIGSGGGALFVNFNDLLDNMNDDKWDELVNALQNKKPIFEGYDYSEEGITEDAQTPVDGYIFLDENEEINEIILKRLYGGGYGELIITKNGSDDYEVNDSTYDYQPYGDYQPTLQAGSGISIDGNNVISVTGVSITVDSELDETSNNPVANSAVTTVIIDDEEVISRAINDLNDRLVAVESGGSSVTVDTSLDSGSTNPVANSAITVALDAKANTSDLTIITNNVETISGAVDGKQDVLSAGTGIEISGNVISATGGGGVTVDPTLDSGSTNPVANSAITTAIDAKANKTGCLGDVRIDTAWSYGSRLMTTNADGSGEQTRGYFSKINGNYIANNYSFNTMDFQLVEKSAVTSAITSASTNDEVAGAKAVYDAINAKADASTTYTKTEVNNLVNNKFWCGTQAQYDALTTKENDVLYLIHE